MITISESASGKIKEIIAAESVPNLFLRLGVKPGGCSGFSYTMGLDDNEYDNDRVFEIHGIKVAIEDDNLEFLEGAIVDYKEVGAGGGFTIDNPNAVSSCGCGSSFKAKNHEHEGKEHKCDCDH